MARHAPNRGIDMEKAHQLLLDAVQPVAGIEVSLEEALGRVLTRDMKAPMDLPPFAQSPWDGYALRSEDTQRASNGEPVLLPVVATIAAGQFSDERLQPRTAVEIMTGAPLPPEADTVVRQEDVVVQGEQIRVAHPVPVGNYLAVGAEVRRGQPLLGNGAVLTPSNIGLLAAMGQAKLTVYRRPRVGIIVTGSELVSPGQPLGNGQLYSSNLYWLMASVKLAGGYPFPLGIVPDDLTQLTNVLRDKVRDLDLLITTGGVGGGQYDLVARALQQLGADLLFHKVDMRPGSGIIAARLGKVLTISLSGSPPAAGVSFELLTRPVLLRLSGRVEWRRPTVTASLADPWPRRSAVRHFLWARALVEEDGWVVRLDRAAGPIPGPGFTALVELAAGSGPLAVGARLTTRLMMSTDPGVDGLGPYLV